MADYRVRSTDGNNSDDGSTWALAKADLHTPTWAAGDRIYVSQAHAQSTASAVTIATNGTIAAPVQIICGNDAADPPTAVAETASVTTTGISALSITGSVYVDGLILNCGTGATSVNITMGGTGVVQTYRNGSANLVNTGAAAKIITAGDECNVNWRDYDVKFANVAQRIQVTSGMFSWRGGSILAGGSAIAALLNLSPTAVRGGVVEISDVDLSNGATAMHLADAASNGAWKAIFNNVKLPAGWTGEPFTGTTTETGLRVELYNAQISGGAKIYAWVKDMLGQVKSDLAVYRVGGAMIGTDALSMKMTTAANAEYPAMLHRGPWIERAFPGTDAEEAAWSAGASVAVSLDFVHDTNVAAGQGAGTSSAFQNDEFWIEVVTIDTSGAVIGTAHSSAPATVLTAAADYSASSETWTTTGLTTPAKQTMSVAVAPQEKGTIRARVIGAKASKEIWYCPKLTVA